MADREKVIYDIERCICHVPDACRDCSHYQDDPELDCMEKLLADALPLLKEQEWNILTEDADGIVHGLPGDDGQYLMTDGKDIWIDDYVDGVEDGVWLDSGHDIRDVKAWMYMPKLPKEGR